MPIYVLSKQLVDEICKGYQSLAFLNLSKNSISTIENLAPLQCLSRLDLSNNCISRVQNLDCLPLLKELRLAGNCISLLDAADLNLPILELLDLADNKIVDRKQVHSLAVLPSLRRLTLIGNPVANLKNYRPGVARCLPLVKELDSEPLNRLEFDSSSNGASPRWSLSSSTYCSSTENAVSAIKDALQCVASSRASVSLCGEREHTHDCEKRAAHLPEHTADADTSVLLPEIDEASAALSINAVCEEQRTTTEDVRQHSQPDQTTRTVQSKVNRVLTFPEIPPPQNPSEEE
eukprot:6271077-Pyramimonas_sp.AAC.2